MKKFVSGIIVGLLLFTSASVFADSISLIGKKVQGLYSIEKNGVKVADAVIIDGTAYAPVRAVAEAAGTSLSVEGKKIVMEESISAAATIVETSTAQTNTVTKLKIDRDNLTSEISKYEKGIADLETNVIPSYQERAAILETNGKVGEMAKDTLEQAKKLLNQKKSELAALRIQLVELDDKIAELQK